MGEARKRGIFNERVADAHERKLWVEEERRIERLELEASMAICQRRKRIESQQLLATAAGLAMGAGIPFGFSF